MARAWRAAAAVFLTLTRPSLAALNVGMNEPDAMVTKLRQSIFIETSYLEEQPPRQGCSSLDGPACLQARLFGDSVAKSALGGFGVVPDGLLHDLGVQTTGLNFVTPEYSTLEAFRLRSQAVNKEELFEGTEAANMLVDARAGAVRGVLHFSGMEQDKTLPLSFSRGLPRGVVATWDGKWGLRGSSKSGSPAVSMSSLALPAPSRPEDDFALTIGGREVAPAQKQEEDLFVTAVAHLGGSVGYLRFSRPVVVRSLVARWRPGKSAPAALVGGRLGLEGVWATHVDPQKLRDAGWVDLVGGPLQPVDEVVFMAMKGLEIGAVEVVAASPQDFSDFEEEPRPVLLLAPEPLVKVENEDPLAPPPLPQFSLKVKKLSAAAAPFVMSLEEVVERNLRIRGSPNRGVQRATSNPPAPGLMTLEAPLSKVNLTFALQAIANQAVFEHRGLVDLDSSGKKVVAEALLGQLRQRPKQLPLDLRKELKKENLDVAEAFQVWLSGGGGWHRRTPTSLPRNGGEDAIQRYSVAKRWQTKLDLLTCAFLYLRGVSV